MHGQFCRTLLALTFLVATAGCGVRGGFEGHMQRSDGSRGNGSRWASLPDAPLTPRRSAHAFWVGGRLLVVGGTGADACPPNADCVEPADAPLRDGATYDPRSETWTTVAEAPVPLGPGSAAVVGGHAYLLLSGHGSSHPSVRSAFLAFDAETGRWSELAHPGGGGMQMLAPHGGTVIAYHSTQENGVRPDLIYNAARDTWAELPPDPLQPSFDRTFVGTPVGAILFGIEDVAQPGVEPATYRAALLQVDRWRRLPDSEIVGWNPMWSLLESHLININIDMVDGGETNNYGRLYPTGGIFDIESRSWKPLPDTPKTRGDFDGIYAAGGRFIVSGQGWVFDGIAGRWIALDRPRGAPHAEAAAVWMDESLVVWGGVRWHGSRGELLNDGWIWEPASI